MDYNIRGGNVSIYANLVTLH